MPNWRFLILALVHLNVDCYTAFLPALWLPIQCTFGLKEWQTGILMGLVLMPASLMQPLFGAISDRFNAKWMVVIGPLVVVVCASMVGLSSHLLLTVLLLLLAAAGTGAFHPEGAMLANRFGAAGSSKAMAIFIGFGFVGQTIGPWWISRTITGPQGEFGDTWQTIFPGLVIVVIGIMAITHLRTVRSPVQRRGGRSLNVLLAGRHRAVWCLIALTVARWCVIMLLLFTLPLYLQKQLDIGRWMAVFNGAQGIGLVVGGLTAPPLRERKILASSLAWALLPGWILPFVDGGGAAVALIAVGFCLGWSIPIAIQLGQALVPGGERWITGMLIGFSWGIGTVTMAPVAGYLCAAYSPRHALVAAAMILTACVLLATALPSQAAMNRLSTR